MSAEAKKQLAQTRLDALEAEAPGELGGAEAVDGEYEFEDDYDDDEDDDDRNGKSGAASSSRRGGKASSRGPKTKRNKPAVADPHIARALGQRRPPRLADLLLADGIGELDADEPDAVTRPSDESAPAPPLFGRRRPTAADAVAAGVTLLTLSRDRPDGSVPSSRPMCVVTGYPANYRDPRTHKPYRDKAALTVMSSTHGT